MEFFKICIYFTVFCFAGWVSETIICSHNAGHFVKRGFLAGPFLPVYGFGGLIIVILLAPLKEWPLLLYVVGVISVTILEYITALLLEGIFHLKLWDYSAKRFNYKGRIWIVSSLFFGVLGLFGTYIVNPPLVSLVERLSDKTIKILGICIIIYFVLDTVTSTIALTSIRVKIKKLGAMLEEMSIDLEENLQQRREQRSIKTSWFQRRLLDAYPNMQHHKDDKLVPYLRAKVATTKQLRDDMKKERKEEKKQMKSQSK